MKKQFKLLVVMIVCAMFTFMCANVYATGDLGTDVVTEKDVTTEAELLEAIADTNVTTINIANDITTTAKVNITRDLTINGNSHTITLNVGDNTVWGGHYVLQAYRCNVAISDIALTGGNAGLLVNGAEVTLTGTIDLSGNGFGGMEIAPSDTYEPFVYLAEATIVNTTEEEGKPTMWEDPILETFPIDSDDRFVSFAVTKGEGEDAYDQYFYYLEYDNAYGSVDEQLEEQLAQDDLSYVEINAYGEGHVLSKELLNELKTRKNVDVVIYTDICVIEFNTNGIKEEFTSDMSLNINITTKQPFTSNVLKGIKANFLFIDLEYSGVLPDNTYIYFSIDNFAIGEKPSLYYYNAKEDKIELIKDGIVDFNTEYNYACIKINHASTYFISSAEIDLASANANSINTVKPTTPANPNTSDMSIVVAMALCTVSAMGFGYTAKEKFLRK